MTAPNGYQRPAIAGSGVIACGVAACATRLGSVRMLARSDSSAGRAEEEAGKLCGKLDGGDPSLLDTTTEIAELNGCDLIVEAIVEDPAEKRRLLAQLAETAPDADLASTTSSLSLAELGSRSGHPERVFGFHVFNPVTKMELVELCFPEPVRDETRKRARAWSKAIGKTPIEVPDQSGFVVNRLLFPYLFDAVRLLESTGMSAADVDTSMKLGAGHPMGPLALLDMVGLDVATAIGEAMYAETGAASHEPPQRLRELVESGRLGRKGGAGFHEYR